MTKAVRHGEAPIRLRVHTRDEAVLLDLENRRAAGAVPGTGLGRAAIADRAEAVAGTAVSAPADGDPGTWRVSARVPA